jgi:hypothetical protein
VCAADETGQWYLTPQAGYFWIGNERNVDDDWLYGLTFGKRVSDNWSIELNLNNRGPTPAAESSSWIDGAGVGLVCRSSRISPWWAASRILARGCFRVNGIFADDRDSSLSGIRRSATRSGAGPHRL